MALNLPTKPSSTISSAGFVHINRRLPVPDDFPAPMDLGLPDKFAVWRPGQIEAIGRINESDARFVGICAPTGYGKSLVTMTAPLLAGSRAVLLTSTKGLQDQLREDFESISKDIRGQGNYFCPISYKFNLPANTTVSDAPCQCGLKCHLRRGGCRYYDEYTEAQQAQIIVTNYQCWLYDTLRATAANGNLQFGFIPTGAGEDRADTLRSFQRVRMLVMDEVHDAVDELGRFIGVEVFRKECLHNHLEWPDAGEDLEYWKDWAQHWLIDTHIRYEEVEAKLKNNGSNGWARELKNLRDIERKLERLATMQADDDWIKQEQDVEAKSMTSVKFDVLNPARYAEKYLFRGVDKVVLVSATLRPKTAQLLGIDLNDMVFEEYDSSFDPKRRPTTHIDTVRMDYHTEQDDRAMMIWLRRIDQIIRARQDRKGIIHAVSYKRMKFILDNSEFKSIMMTHGNRDRTQIVEEFKNADAPRVLVSPSVDTGYDFAGDQSRYQIIAKIPFASVQDRVIKARQERDKEYGLYLAAQTLVQMTGRIVRSESDWGETFIIDDQARWFVHKVRKFIPQWWMESYKSVNSVPPPLNF